LSSIIKGRLLGRRGGVQGEYVVDPEKVGRGQLGRSRRSRHASPEDAARAIVEDANEQAAALILAARQEAEAIRASAYQEGREASLSELEAEKAALAERLAAIEADVERRVEEFWAAIEPELLRLAVDIAGKIVYREISENDGFVLSTIKAALQQLRDRHELKIRVNPADYELAREHKDEIASSCDGVRSIEIIEDRRVGQGGSLIESSNGHLDARLDTQLGEVERALLEAAHDGSNETAAQPE